MDSLRVSNYILFIACMTPNVSPSAFTKLSANARPMAEPQQAMPRRDTDTDTDMAIMPVMARVPATQAFVTNSVETRCYGSCGSLAPPSPQYVLFSFSLSSPSRLVTNRPTTSQHKWPSRFFCGAGFQCRILEVIVALAWIGFSLLTLIKILSLMQHAAAYGGAYYHGANGGYNSGPGVGTGVGNNAGYNNGSGVGTNADTNTGILGDKHTGNNAPVGTGTGAGYA